MLTQKITLIRPGSLSNLWGPPLFEGFSEHGIIDLHENSPLKIKVKNGLLTIE
jgi:hypothetical protein